jgi:DNA polymerase-1
MALMRAVDDFLPDYLAVCFDTKGGTFRNKEFAGYKAQRPKTAPELVEQLAIIQELLPKLGAAVFAMEGFEADDLIASVIKGAKDGNQGQAIDFFVLTGDYDSLQLVDECVKALIVNRGIKNAVLYDAQKVKDEFGVWPRQMADFKALAGDASDNFPGAPGIGPKAAVGILEKCGSLENALIEVQKDENDDCFGKGARGKNLKDILLKNKEDVLRFQKLATMIDGAPLGDVLQKCVFKNFAGGEHRAALLDLGLASAAKRLPPAGAGRNQTLF